MINPFSALFGNSAALDGLYGAFNGSGNDMWVVSASRAGIRFGEGGTKAEDPGNYHILYPGDTNDLPKYSGGLKTWNLCEEDWDAVMIPVDRAWHDAGSGSWQDSPSAEALLAAVKNQLNPRTPYKNGIGRFIRH